MTDFDMTKASVGALVFVVLPDKHMIIPAQVVERVTRETLNGAQTNYILNFGIAGRERVDMATFSNQQHSVHGTLDDARSALMNEYQRMAEQAVSQATKIQQARFSGRRQAPVPAPQQPVQQFNPAELMHGLPQSAPSNGHVMQQPQHQPIPQSPPMHHQHRPQQPVMNVNDIQDQFDDLDDPTADAIAQLDAQLESRIRERALSAMKQGNGKSSQMPQPRENSSNQQTRKKKTSKQSKTSHKNDEVENKQSTGV